MNYKKSFFIYRPKFNEKKIVMKNLLLLLLDIFVIILLYTKYNTSFIYLYICIRLVYTIVMYVMRTFKYLFVFVKHRLDILVVTNSADLQDDLYIERNLIKDIINNASKELFLAYEFIMLSILFAYVIEKYAMIFSNFNILYTLITHVLFTIFMICISYRMEFKFKVIEERHNLLMFLVSGDKI